MGNKNYKKIEQNMISKTILDKLLEINKKNYYVKKITDKTHPCNDQFGLFSVKRYNKYDIIGEYIGEAVDIFNLDKDFHSDYFAGFSVDGLKGIGIDAQNMGNEMRFINHYKGILTKPNVKFVNYLDGIFSKIMVVCICEINIGEELVVDYGYEP